MELMEHAMNKTAWLETQRLEPSQHLAFGLYLILNGFLSGFLNLIGLSIFATNYDLLWSPSAFLEVGLILGDLCVAGLHPFSGSAMLANKWIWGPVGCQIYSFSGFLFGTFQLMIVPWIAFDRYILACKPSWREFNQV